MSFRYNKLRGRIIEIFGSQAKFAEAIRVSEQTVTAKLNGRSPFSQDDIVTWSEALEIEQCDIGSYFFTQNSSKR